MQMTLQEAMQKIETARTIVREIENGGSVEHRSYDISLLLDEYIAILSNAKVMV